MKILVVGPSWVGDMMMSQSLFRTIKALYPNAIIDVMAPSWCHPLLSFMPEVNEAILIPFEHGVLKINARRNFGYRLRRKCYDRAYILPNSFKSALIPFFAKVPHRIGWCGEMRYGLLTDIRILDRVAWPLMVERYIALAYNKRIVRSAKDLLQPILFPKLYIKEDIKSHTRRLFAISSERPIIGFCLGAEYGPAKCWPHYHYAKLSKPLIEEGYQIALFGSEKHHEASKNMLSMLTKGQQIWCHNLVGKTSLEQVVILIAICKAIVTNDSGLMHVAAALDRPLVALYGPSNLTFTPPLLYKARVIRLINGYQKLRKGSAQSGYHQSLIDITPDLVFKELNELLLSVQRGENASTNY